MWFQQHGSDAERQIPMGRPRRAASPATSRRLVHRSALLQIDDSARAPSEPLGHGYCDAHQIALPYFGVFTWQVEGQRSFVDANTLLFITPGREFLETHPIAGLGHGSAIFTPSDALVDELAALNRSAPDVSGSAVTGVPDDVRLAVHTILFGDEVEPFVRDERAVRLLRRISAPGAVDRKAPPRSVVERAKAILHQRRWDTLSLDDIAREVGVTPIYLTQSFSRAEGMPLYRYQMRLRLGRALLELPRTDNLTELALDLGFSSHSHFTSTFRGAFGVTPSRFRKGQRLAS